MAVITAVIERTNRGLGILALWEAIATSDSGSAVEESEYVDRSVQLVGTAWDSEVITIQGSNDGANWVTLNDLQGNALSFAADGLKGVAECTRYIRPLGDGSGTTVDVDVYLYGKRGVDD